MRVRVDHLTLNKFNRPSEDNFLLALHRFEAYSRFSMSAIKKGLAGLKADCLGGCVIAQIHQHGDAVVAVEGGKFPDGPGDFVWDPRGPTGTYAAATPPTDFL